LSIVILTGDELGKKANFTICGRKGTGFCPIYTQEQKVIREITINIVQYVTA
jgi:hypothetical protein